MTPSLRRFFLMHEPGDRVVVKEIDPPVYRLPKGLQPGDVGEVAGVLARLLERRTGERRIADTHQHGEYRADFEVRDERATGAN